MPESTTSQSSYPSSYPFTRKACLEDFFDEVVDKKNQYNKNYSYNDANTIAKNQQEFGHKKRIKP